MASSTQIKIYGKTYNIKSAAFSVDPEEVASFVDAKMRELSMTPGKTSTMDLAILTALNIAHDFLELQNGESGSDPSLNEKLDGLIKSLENTLKTNKR